jgi:hypothetical protein
MALELKPRSLGVGVALSAAAPSPASHEPQAARRSAMDFCSALQKNAPTWVCKIPPSSIEKLIPNQSVLAKVGDPITINGRNLKDVTGISFGSKAAKPTNRCDGEMKVPVPAGADRQADRYHTGGVGSV